MVEFKVGDIVKFKEGVKLDSDGCHTKGNSCFYTTGRMKVIDLFTSQHLKVEYLDIKHDFNYAYRSEVEPWFKEVKYDPNQMIAEEDDL